MNSVYGYEDKFFIKVKYLMKVMTTKLDKDS